MYCSFDNTKVPVRVAHSPVQFLFKTCSPVLKNHRSVKIPRKAANFGQQVCVKRSHFRAIQLPLRGFG